MAATSVSRSFPEESFRAFTAQNEVWLLCAGSLVMTGAIRERSDATRYAGGEGGSTTRSLTLA
jgi:hypothetical protein